MMETLSRQLRFIKEPVRGRGGVVAASNQAAADVGARILGQGGNAVDAAIATAFATAILEPWAGGLGGVGCMTLWHERQRRGHVISFPGRASRHAQRPPAAGNGAAAEEGVPESGGYRAIAVPGLPDGLWIAHAFGSKPWTVLVAPAVELAEAGLDADWRVLLIIGLAAAELRRFAASRGWFLPRDAPPSIRHFGAEYTLRNPALTATLKGLAERGARDFYEGMIAHAIQADLARGGSFLDKADFAQHRATLVEPATVAHSGKRFLFPPDSEQAKLFVDSMHMAENLGPALNPSAFINFVHILSAAHSERAISGRNHDFDEWSAHVSVVDRDGNMASLTQSLGSLFGAKVVLPETGLLANNAAPPPDLAGGPRLVVEPGEKTPNTFFPLIGVAGERPWIALGAAGNRNVLPTLLQLVWFLSDFGFSLTDAFHQPRVSVGKSGEVAVDITAPGDVKDALGAAFRAAEQPSVLFPFSRPCAVAAGIDPYSGDCLGMTEPAEAWAGAAAPR